MKSRVKKRVIALMLCMVMVLSSGISTLAEGDAGTPEATEEVNSTTDESTVNTEADTADVTDAQSRMNTAAETEETTEETVPTESETTDTTTQESVTDDTTVTETAEDEAKAQSTEPAETEQNDGGNSQNTSDEIQVMSTWSSLYGLSGYNTISHNTYNLMLNRMLSEVEGNDPNKVYIKNWARSAGSVEIPRVTARDDWSWSDVSGLDLSVENQTEVWDGSRVTDTGDTNHKYDNYLDKGLSYGGSRITASNGELYDSATWTCNTNSDSKSTMYRFQGEFSLGNIDPNNYSFTLAPVTGENQIYINDDIYVFVYPKNTTLTDDNFMDYLAFWTGTISQYEAGQSFHGRRATTATHGQSSGFGRLTDGWYLSAVEDNAGNAILNAYNNEGKTEFVVDVFVDDYDSGGGMYRLQMNTEPVSRKTISFTKVDSVSGGIVPGAFFELESADGNGRYYSATSDSNGVVRLQVMPGTYTMTETAPAGYEQPNNTWTVRVRENGTYTITWNGSSSANNVEGNQNSGYKISNTSSIRGSYSFRKVNSSGEGLPEAEFTIYQGETVIATVTSGADGAVAFTNLPVGTYTVKETKAPAGGYVCASDTWVLEVKPDGYGAAITNMYLEGDGSQTPVEKIINTTEHEEAVKNLTSGKTVEVVGDEKNRTYEINLTATTSGGEEGQDAKAASVVLVLDASSSMDEDGKSLEDIKKAAISFVNQLAEKSAQSEVAVVWYSGTEGYSNTTSTQSFKTLNNEENIESIESFINRRWASGATPMGDALEEADHILSSRLNSDKYVLLFTDGMPGYFAFDTGRNCMVANHACNEADDIKKYAKLYTIGYKLSDSFRWEKGHSESSSYDHDRHNTTTPATDFLEDYIATKAKDGKTYALTTENSDGLNKIFTDIAGQIGSLYTVQAEKIVDVIDARFELTDASKKELEEEYGDNIAISTEADGTTVITWTGEAALIGNQAAQEGSKGWSATFRIKAKDDFIGGNMVPTNGAASGIYIDADDNVDKAFPQPSVNVYPLSLELQDEGITVYKGDLIDPKDFADELAAGLKVVTLDGNKVTTGVQPADDQGNPTFPPLTEEQIEALEANYTITLGGGEEYKYVYPETTDAVGYFIYTYRRSSDPGGDMREHAADTIKDSNPEEVYELEVQFIPYSVTNRDVQLNDAITVPTDNGGTELTRDDPNQDTAERLTRIGKYSVNVKSGEIRITKKVKTTTQENRDFTFNVTKVGSDVKTITITIPAGKTEATYAGVDLKDLARGEYVVTETTTGYAVTGLVIGTETNCYYTPNPDGETATFKLGWNVNNANVIADGVYNGGGVLGVVEYTNDRVLSDWEIVKRSKSDTNSYLEGAVFELKSDAITYYGKSNANGVVEWFTHNPNDEEFNEGSDKLQEEIAKGTYTFGELTAPTGYVKSEETWTIEFAAPGEISSIISSENSDENMVDKVITGEQQAIFYFDNSLAYDLPSTGGPGIYWYMLGGVLLMMAGSLLVYKKRRGEVLRRK